MEDKLVSQVTDIKFTECGDLMVTRGGQHYPVKRESLSQNELIFLGYLAVMANLPVDNGEVIEESRKAYIYHNAEDANELCLERIEKEKP